MRIFTNKIIILIFIVLTGMSGYADEVPPAPAPKNGNSINALGPPGDPDLPIDKNISLLALAGVLFGTYIIYNHKQNKKRPI
jgi:hypothetical protein